MTLLGQAAISVLAIFMALLSATLVYLWLSIRPREFDLATPDDDILAFVRGAVAASRADGGGELTARQATDIRNAARDRLLTQWATSATLNRRTNQLRELHRARASRFLLLSIAAIPILIGVDVIQSRSQALGVSGHVIEHGVQTVFPR